MKKNKKHQLVCSNLKFTSKNIFYIYILIFILYVANPNVFNFYVYLRTHPLLIRHYLASTYQDTKNHTVVLAGFSYGSDSRCRETSDRQVLICILIVFKLKN